jgi:hypothetical protein
MIWNSKPGESWPHALAVRSYMHEHAETYLCWQMRSSVCLDHACLSMCSLPNVVQGLIRVYTLSNISILRQLQFSCICYTLPLAMLGLSGEDQRLKHSQIACCFANMIWWSHCTFSKLYHSPLHMLALVNDDYEGLDFCPSLPPFCGCAAGTARHICPALLRSLVNL